MSSPTQPAAIVDAAVYRSLFEAYPDALLLTGPGGQIMQANPAAERLLGYPEGALIGLSVDVLVPDAIRPRHADYRHAYSHSPRARPMGTQMELVARRFDGSEVMVETLGEREEEALTALLALINDKFGEGE